jgi:hypothetical protein
MSFFKELVGIFGEDAASSQDLCVQRKQEVQYAYNVTFESRSRIIVAVEKQYALLIGLCACVNVGTRARGRVHAHTFK